MILAGGIVRSTGSGMGCPDWPKCFGTWLPPTSEAQLPANYRERFAEIRMEKNQHLAAYLETLGFNNLSQEIQSESIAAPEASFNRVKTWTEYINRLFGVVLGFLISVMSVVSINFRKSHPALFYGSVAALLLVIFQGWIGSVVVSTNLLPGMVTFHMMLAALLIGWLIYLFQSSSDDHLGNPIVGPKMLKLLLPVAMILFLIQIIMGTQVREAIDLAALQMGETQRNHWIGSLGSNYYFHRSFSILLLAITGYLVVLLRRSDQPGLKAPADFLFMLVIAEVILGVVMAYFGIPAWVQPLHLLVSLMIPGLLYWIYLKTKKANQA